MLDTITKYTPALLTGLTRHSYVLILCIATLLVIFTWALLRLYRARIIAITRYDIYASQANLVMNLYLNITGKAYSKEKPEEISNLVLHLSGSSSAYCMAWIGITSTLTSISIIFITAVITSPLITSAAVILGVVSIIINIANLRIRFGRFWPTVWITRANIVPRMVLSCLTRIASFILVKDSSSSQIKFKNKKMLRARRSPV